MIAVVVKSASRTRLDDFAIYRPTQAGDIKLVVMVKFDAEDGEILRTVRGLLSDEELTALREALE